MKPVRTTLATLTLGVASLTTLGTTPASASTVTGSAQHPRPPGHVGLGLLGHERLWGPDPHLGQGQYRSHLLPAKAPVPPELPVTYANNARYCHVNFYAYVTVAANPTPVYRPWHLKSSASMPGASSPEAWFT